MSGGIGEIKAGDLSVLSKLTQKMAPSSFAESKCGASCVVAAVIYSGGREGLSKLADATMNKAKGGGLELSSEYSDLASKIKDKNKPLTKEDISKLQDMLYLVMTNMQSNKQRESGTNLNTNGGIHSTILNDFIKSLKFGVISQNL